MSYDEEQQKRSRVVVETPTARREVVHQQTTRYPERKSFSTGMVAAVALTAIAVTAIIFLFLMNSGDNSTEANINVRTAAATQPTPLAQTPVIIQQQPVAAATPIIIQQAPPVIIQQPPPTTETTTPAAAPPPATSSGADDTTLQMKVETAFRDDPDISVSNIIGTVINGKATLTGEVKTPTLKQKAERLVRSVKGISSVENKVTVNPNMP